MATPQAVSPLKATDRGRTPLFIRVYQLLRRRLQAGQWSVGDQLPAPAKFAKGAILPLLANIRPHLVQSAT